MTDSDHAWVDRLGPAFAPAAVARLLGRPAAGIASDPGLLRLTDRNIPVVSARRYDEWLRSERSV